jgi:CheY-like chemotaxis protein
MLRRLIREDITLVTKLASDLDSVRVDAGQMEQVLLNLVVNARDAMPAGGTLTIETRNVELDSSYVRARPGVATGRHVLLAVSDTGVGMDEDVRAHLFEPFFTTKEPGQGTGLGLATVHGIVRQSGGHVWAYSEVGKGSSIKIYVPAVGEAAERLPPKVSDTDGLPAGTETVLVAEDDDAVRAVTVEALRRVGYTVLAAPSGEEALALAGSHDGEVHLLLTDVVMPGLGVRELVAALAALHPGARVLYMSGYTDDAINHQGLLEPTVNYIEKPFTPAKLIRHVRRLLDGQA